MFKYQVTIQETYLDFLGHVNNARYLELFEQARWEAIHKYGYGLDRIQELQQGPIILEAQIRYLRELKQRDVIDITVETLEYQGKIGRLKQQMINAQGQICAELIVTVGLFDMKSRKLITSTPEWQAVIDHLNNHNSIT